MSNFPTSVPGSFPFFTDYTTFWTFPSTSKTSSSSSSATQIGPSFTRATESQTSSSSTYSSPSSTSSHIPYGGGKDHDDDGDNFLDGLGSNTKTAMAIGIVVGVIILVTLSVWYCCGCCGLRARRRKRREAARGPPANNQPVPLRTINTGDAPQGGNTGDAPPPRYEEAVPPQHQHIAGGATHVREEEEGIISDGKTPLSEIPFEDVVLDHSPSEGSSRSFSERHHGLGGDTRGHTNS